MVGRLRVRRVFSGTWLAAVGAVSLGLASAARAEDVALTFDDLPSLTFVNSTRYMEVTTRRLLAGLRRHHLPATGFVNEIKLEGADRPARIALLSQWLDAGMDLGNHSYSHFSLTTTPVEAYSADVLRGEAVTRPLLAARGKQLRWFRHPFLETGPTLEIRHRFEDWLTAHDYRVAPVTMENSDWEYALPYDEAILHRDKAAAKRIKREYLAYTDAITAWYRRAAFGMLDRRIAFIYLLHATRLNADSIGDLARLLRKNELHAVTLDSAMADPVYRMADTYAGPDGNNWIDRWSMLLHKNLPWGELPKVSADIESASNRLDKLSSPTSVR